MSDAIDVSGLDEAELLAALYNAAKPIGMGWFQADPSHKMTVEEARDVIARVRSSPLSVLRGGDWKVDYVMGRSLKVAVRGGVLTGAMLYDRDQGAGQCARIIEQLRTEAA